MKLIICNSNDTGKLIRFTPYAQNKWSVCGVCDDPGDAEYEEVAEIPRGFRQICLPARYGDYLTRREIETYLPLERGEISKNAEEIAAIEDVLCEQDTAAAARIAAIEDALCELDKEENV